MTITRGRPPRQIKILEARELTREDLAALSLARPPKNRVMVIKETHHRIARLFAFGYDAKQVADVSGYSSARLSQFLRDPAFAQLVAEYRNKITQSDIDAYDEVKAEGLTALRKGMRMVNEHFEMAEETGELIPLRTLIPAVSSLADRFGYGKHNTTTNVNVNFASEIEEAHARSSRARVIEGRTVSSPRPSAMELIAASPDDDQAPSQPSIAASSRR